MPSLAGQNLRDCLAVASQVYLDEAKGKISDGQGEHRGQSSDGWDREDTTTDITHSTAVNDESRNNVHPSANHVAIDAAIHAHTNGWDREDRDVPIYHASHANTAAITDHGHTHTTDDNQDTSNQHHDSKHEISDKDHNKV